MTKGELEQIKIKHAYLPSTVEVKDHYSVVALIQALEQAWAERDSFGKEVKELHEEIDLCHQRLVVLQKNLDDTFGNMLEAQEERDDLKRQHKDCLEQKEALRERAETLELGYRGFP